jgi:hypothetical protein
MAAGRSHKSGGVRGASKCRLESAARVPGVLLPRRQAAHLRARAHRCGTNSAAVGVVCGWARCAAHNSAIEHGWSQAKTLSLVRCGVYEAGLRLVCSWTWVVLARLRNAVEQTPTQTYAGSMQMSSGNRNCHAKP